MLSLTASFSLRYWPAVPQHVIRLVVAFQSGHCLQPLASVFSSGALPGQIQGPPSPEARICLSALTCTCPASIGRPIPAVMTTRPLITAVQNLPSTQQFPVQPRGHSEDGKPKTLAPTMVPVVPSRLGLASVDRGEQQLLDISPQRMTSGR